MEPTVWISKIKKRFVSLELIPSQQIHSFNSNPYFMILASICQIAWYIYVIKAWIDYESVQPSQNHEWAFLICCNIRIILAHLLIAIPFEIIHGTLLMSIVYALITSYPHIIGTIIVGNYRYIDTEPSTFGLIGLFIANQARNWQHLPFKIPRVLLTVLLILPGLIFQIIKFIVYKAIRPFMFYWTCEIGGILIGFLLGYNWIYRNRSDDKVETKWRNCGIILTILVFYMILAEFSGLHITWEEFYRHQ
ncbi:unnamed protein product [Caenorhabditis angaria]|uniref:Uncharacterized protein n=1 Tax=Caenorhabditis angaria TaxID=860376 RepID=A0A9P1IFA2_9PELO|nr:unnamed protein product [Caenorhabditis angaria]